MHKRLIVGLVFAGTLGIIAFSAFTGGNTQKSGGGPPYNANAPGDQTCSGVEGSNSCHSGGIPDNSGPASTSITFSGGNTYVPGQTYTVSIKITHPTRNRFGFQIVSILNSTLTNAGTVTLTDTLRTQTQIPNWGSYQDRNYVMHVLNGTYGTGNQNQWSYQWTAPSTNAGAITFYACFLAANNNNTNDSGDETYFRSLTINPVPAGIRESAEAGNKLLVYPNPAGKDLHLKLEDGCYLPEDMAIFNLNGQKEMDIRNSAGLSEINFNLGTLPSGEHIIQLTMKDGIISRKFIRH
ncbi:MAG TPA: choice-of-anchor V domain-containing protein [Bacteroidia bacterium]|jgi:hypothetical protein|nr:choice-of-anchor V domain-containing protein [Bacteroidia bacterium]